MIRALVRDAAGVRVLEPTPANLRAALADGDCTLWIDIKAGATDELTPLGALLDFHPLAVEDALGNAEHPKMDDYGSYLYVVVHGLDCTGTGDGVRVLELDVFLGSNYVVTFHHEPLHCVDSLWERSRRDERYLQRGPDGVTHAVIDILVDDLMPVLERLDATVEDLEEEILDSPSQRTLTRLLAIKRGAMQMRRTIVPEREVIYRLSRDESALVRAKTRLYFRDVYDHLVRVADTNESLRDLAEGALEVYLSVVSNRMNEVMKVLTLVTTVFMPLTLLAGIYGMNFRYLPELEWRYGYYAVLGLMVTVAAGMTIWFRRRGWV